MKYVLKGNNFPVVECTLDKGEKIITESGAMCWMDSNIKMETKANGGIPKLFGRYISREKIFQNVYSSTNDNSLFSFCSCVPGSIMPVEINEKKSIICQKSAFLAAYGDIKLSVHFNKKISSSIFGGEGFIMQKITGKGIAFLEIDGSSIEYELSSDDSLVISSGFLVSMSESCTISVELIKGFKNVFLGGEGLFNTIIKGPGRVVVQTMPLSKFCNLLSNNIKPKYINNVSNNNQN